MPTLNPEQLEAVQQLLKEGRPTEADKMLDSLATDLKNQAAQELASKPAPGPKTIAELQSAWRHAVSNALGVNPKVEGALTELEGAIERAAPPPPPTDTKHGR